MAVVGQVVEMSKDRDSGIEDDNILLAQDAKAAAALPTDNGEVATKQLPLSSSPTSTRSSSSNTAFYEATANNNNSNSKLAQRNHSVSSTKSSFGGNENHSSATAPLEPRDSVLSLGSLSLNENNLDTATTAASSESILTPSDSAKDFIGNLVIGGDQDKAETMQDAQDSSSQHENEAVYSATTNTSSDVSTPIVPISSRFSTTTTSTPDTPPSSRPTTNRFQSIDLTNTSQSQSPSLNGLAITEIKEETTAVKDSNEDEEKLCEVELNGNNNSNTVSESFTTATTTTNKEKENSKKDNDSRKSEVSTKTSKGPHDAGVFSSFSLPWGRRSRANSTKSPPVSTSSASTQAPPVPPSPALSSTRMKSFTSSISSPLFNRHDSSSSATNTNDDSSSFVLKRLSNQNTYLESNAKAKRASIHGQEALRKGFEKLHTQILHEHNGNEDDDEIDWVFWGDVMNDYEQVAKTRGRQLAEAIQKGIPKALRGMMWQLLSSSKDTELESVYSTLLKQKSPHEKSIIRDINRTFPQHEYFKDVHGAGQENLFNVVKAYSLYDPDVGYCQGLQFIVGPLLLNMPEEEAFCVLVRLMKSYNLRSHFLPNMPGLQLRLYQFDRLLEEFASHVSVHLLRLGIKSSMYASQWILTLFGYRFPLELISRVFDLVFAEGVEAVFRFAIAVMIRNDEAILKLDFENVLNFLKVGVFECYERKRGKKVDGEEGVNGSVKQENQGEGESDDLEEEGRYRAREFSRDALGVRITPQMLDGFKNEYDSKRAEDQAKDNEIAQLRQINRQLSAQVRQLESTLAQVNQEHCDLVKQVVTIKLEKEELEEELVKCKLSFADMAHRAAAEEIHR